MTIQSVALPRMPRVLVVDDDPANLELLERRLEAGGYESTLVANGRSALLAAQVGGFDAVLLDIRLPDMDGLEVLARLRESCPGLPVVMMTAHGSETIAVTALTAGAANYLIKPIGRREMLGALRTAIDNARLLAENRRMQQSIVASVAALEESRAMALREHRRVLTLLATLQEGVLITDAAGQIELLNDAGLRLMRLETAPVTVQELLFGLASIRLEDGATLPAEHEDLVSTLSAMGHTVRTIVRWPDGIERAFLVSYNQIPARDMQARAPGNITIFQDVTRERSRRLRLEKLLETHADRLQRSEMRRQAEVARASASAEQAKEQLLQLVSHELRTPLNFITGMGSLLAEGVLGDLSPEQQGLVAQMLLGAEQLTRAIDNLLDYAMLGSDMLHPQMTRVSLQALAREVVEEHAQAAAARGLELHLVVAAEQEPRHGDPHLVAKVLSHLLSNAIKFTPPPGTVTVRVFEQPRRHIAGIAVEDTGPGIAASDLARMFEPFQQLESGSTRRFGGTGMGLALARGIASRMGLALDVSSDLGRGSTFSIVWSSPEADPST